ncbi:MAG: thymidylate synthase [Dehalococcoidia bacterium]|nr:thymidylate synthase [Dehalococcoidia bacterium]
MRVTTIEARDLPEAWFLSLRATLAQGYEYRIDRGSFQGQRRKELDLVVVQIREPAIRPLVPDVPAGVPPPTTMEYVESYLPYLMTSFRAENEQYTYGEDLEPQMGEVIRMYRESGHNTNQAYMAVGNRDSIYLPDPPCLRGIHTRIRYGRFHFVVYFRSWDLWGGFPSNLAGLQLMKEHMASEIGVPDGEMICLSSGLHLYEHAWEWAKLAARLE